MQALLDFLPVIAFFATYVITDDINLAMIVIMVAMSLQVAITWLVTRTISRMLLSSAALVLLFGGISLYLDNPIFFKWKPTVLYWLFALVLVGSQFIGDHPLIKRMMQSVSDGSFDMPERAWIQLNTAWAGFFTFAGLTNIYVAYSFEEATWVNFKMFGLLGMTLAFLVLQSLWLSKFISDSPETSEEDT